MSAINEQLEHLDSLLDQFEEADSDKRYNAARRAVFDQWDIILDALYDWEDEPANKCDLCGDEIEDGERYCLYCLGEMENDDDWS